MVAGLYHTVGLRSDATVFTTGDTLHGQCDVGDGSDVVQVIAGGIHTAGLKSSSSIPTVEFKYWRQCNVGGLACIIEVAAGGYYAVGLNFMNFMQSHRA